MLDKSLILVWILLGSVLVIENVVSWYPAYLFLDTSANLWITMLIAILIGVMIWYWIRWKISKSSNQDDDFDY